MSRRNIANSERDLHWNRSLKGLKENLFCETWLSLIAQKHRKLLDIFYSPGRSFGHCSNAPQCRKIMTRKKVHSGIHWSWFCWCGCCMIARNLVLEKTCQVTDLVPETILVSFLFAGNNEFVPWSRTTGYFLHFKCSLIFTMFSKSCL